MNAFSKTLSALALAALTLPGSAAQADPVIGIRNFRELFDSMAVVTGVPSSNASVREYYAKVRSTLPLEGRASEITGEALWSITGLALAFCESAAQKEARQDSAARALFVDVDFDGDPATELGPGRLNPVLQRLATRFWQRSATAAELAQLATVAAAARMDADAGDSRVRAGYVAVCAVALSSLDSIRN